jgi:hypothetical protein
MTTGTRRQPNSRTGPSPAHAAPSPPLTSGQSTTSGSTAAGAIGRRRPPDKSGREPAKGASGHTRSSRWLGDGLPALAGSDEDFVDDPRDDEQSRIRAAGLSLIDTRNWSVRTIDRDATEVRVEGDLLLATGSSWDPSTRKEDAIGLAA